jgi:tetratricopeptide (TPR) repeat protein
MKPTIRATSVLLVATIAAVGCSKKGATSQDKTGASVSANAIAAPSNDFLAAKPTGEDGFAESATPKFAGPVSFADGEAAYHAKKYGDATAIFDRYTAQRPKNAWGHYMLGLSAWKSGDPKKAEQAFEAALSVDPNHVKSLVNLSRVFIEQKQHDEAIDRLTRAAEIEPESVVVYRLLGRTHHVQGQTDEAIKAYARAIELNELDAWSMNNLGLVYLETQRAGDAAQWFAKAVELKQDVAAFHNNLGMALEHTGRFRAAATAYSGALAADPGYAKAKQNLARVEAVRTGPEEPFVIETTAKAVEDVEIAADAQTASK